ncbi:uncharacterized protein TTMY_0534 [Thermus thermophilus]|nr:uncharacterized protein TTMY_0534 [Thermus thermophilus]
MVKRPKPHPRPCPEGQVEEGGGRGEGETQEVVAEEVEGEEKGEASQVEP